jgi:hypothetical protein
MQVRPPVLIGVAPHIGGYAGRPPGTSAASGRSPHRRLGLFVGFCDAARKASSLDSTARLSGTRGNAGGPGDRMAERRHDADYITRWVIKKSYRIRNPCGSGCAISILAHRQPRARRLRRFGTLGALAVFRPVQSCPSRDRCRRPPRLSPPVRSAHRHPRPSAKSVLFLIWKQHRRRAGGKGDQRRPIRWPARGEKARRGVRARATRKRAALR